MAAKEQIRKIYAIGTQLGIKGRGRDDLLHELVYGERTSRTVFRGRKVP